MRRAASADKPLSLLMVDIDFFKNVNDTHGHPVGDKVLKELSKRMIKNLREFDMAARAGGEEFVVVMPDCPPEIAVGVADRLRGVIGDTPFDVIEGGEPLQVTISVGVAYASGDDSPDLLLARADEALYAAKRGGRNQVVAPPDMPGRGAAAAG
jgi:two-component system cell cycle response regulator